MNYKTRFWQFSDEEESPRPPNKLRQTLSGSPKATTLADVCSLVSLSKKPHSNVSFSIFQMQNGRERHGKCVVLVDVGFGMDDGGGGKNH